MNIEMGSINPDSIPNGHEDTNLKKRNININEDKENKKQKVDVISGNDDIIDLTNANTATFNKNQQDKLDRILQKEQEKIIKEKKKEEERRKKEEERQRKLAEKEMEKELKRKKLEEEKKERERKKEEERKLKEQKREAERLERELKKEQERVRKQNEKEERERQRLEKKRKLEEEKEKKEEEKRKLEDQKNKNQMKISSFFSVGQKKIDQKKDISNSITTNEEQELTHAYNKAFLPFYVKRNMQMAGSFVMDKEDLEKSISQFDVAIQSGPTQTSDLLDFFSSRAKKSDKISYTSPQEILHALNSSDVTESKLYSMIQNIPPVKYLQFYENSKPPYIGTWCSGKHQSVQIPVSDPFNTSLTGLDYEYDSDLEWNGEEEEGEDLDNDDEDDEEEEMEEEDELDDFVEGTDNKRRKKFMGPLVSFTKWNDGNDDEYFDGMKYELLDIRVEFPIAPNDEPPKKTCETPLSIQVTETVNYPASKTQSPNIEETTHTLVPKKKVIEDGNIIAELITFIEKNNDFTIGTLVELSQKELKTFTKAILKHTIQCIASYNKKASKWEVDPEMKEKYKHI